VLLRSVPSATLSHTYGHVDSDIPPLIGQKDATPGEFMQQRRLRLGDIVDDYCPRERRITNHAVVAMVEDEVKHTRCTTCDADHEYKQAKVPPQRRRKDAPAAIGVELPGSVPRKRVAVPDDPIVEAPIELPPDDERIEELPIDSPAVAASPSAPSADDTDDDTRESLEDDDDGPVHRPLIRATLPRPEGQVPERKLPDFTAHQHDINGNRPGRGPRRGPRPGQMRGPQGSNTGQTRFGGPRHGSGQPPRQGQGPGQGPRHGSGQGQRHGGPQGQRPGAPQGQRPRGRKRGR
jgi:hypothetical protein